MLTRGDWHDFTVSILECKEIMKIYRDHLYGLNIIILYYHIVLSYHFILHNNILNTPSFGHYMSQNHFQNILWNLHVSDSDETNPQKGEGNHDPLFLVRPMVDIMQRNIFTKYRPRKELSLDESTCPFRDRVHCKCYNPKKTKQVPY